MSSKNPYMKPMESGSNNGRLYNVKSVIMNQEHATWEQ